MTSLLERRSEAARERSTAAVETLIEVSPSPRVNAGLRLADDLVLPVEAVTQKFAFLAQSGAGKSYAAMKLAEEMLSHHMQVIVLDPVGVWWGLRGSADGKTAGLPIAVFGGEHGDLPLAASTGALVADLVVDEAISAVLDVSDFELPEMKRFVAAFAERFFQRKKRTRGPVHLFLEEVQSFAPQTPERDETMMLNRVERIARIGRNYGIGWSGISQRPQEVHKKVLNQAGTLIALRTIGRHERKAITDWVADKAQTEAEVKLLDGLASLETGVARVWSPAFLKVAREVRIARRRTFDSSATPSVGAVAGTPRTVVQVDVARLRSALDAAVAAQTSVDEDLPDLRSRNESARGVRTTATQAQVEVKIERVEVPVVTPELALELRLAIAQASAAGDRLASVAAAVMRALNSISPNTMPPASRIEAFPVPRINQVPRSHRRPPPMSPAPRPQRTQVASGLTGPQQRVIDAVATLRHLGLDRPQKAAVAAMARYSPTSGGYANLLGQLKTAGLIDYPMPGLVMLTKPGVERGTPHARVNQLEDFHQAWMEILSEPRRKLLRVLIARYPAAMLREELAGETGYSPTSGGFANLLGQLRTLGVVDYPGRGQVAATELLFPPLPIRGH
jgi:uncharacterized protein